MMKAKVFVAAVAVAALTSGCMCMQGRCSRHTGGPVATGEIQNMEEAANRAEAAANRAEAAADRASMASEKSEAVFRKGLRK